MLCRDCGLFECSMRTPLGGCLMESVPLTTKPIKEEDFALSLAELEEKKFWESFRREAAKDFMSAIIVREAPQYDTACRNIASRVSEAIMWADELVRQLWEEQNHGKESKV